MIILADCVEAMRDMDACSVDSIVTDPPYSLSFMGSEWDSHADPASFQKWCETWAAEALRVLKPGGHLLAFGGTRTYHRLAAGLEDAGFEIRDTLAWMYGSGFPKSLDVSKAIDKAAGAEREVLGVNPTFRGSESAKDTQAKWNNAVLSGVLTAPATPEAEQWAGWGTALKPAYEPVVLARKPLAGTVAANVLAHGVGALNIDGCRVKFVSEEDKAAAAAAAMRSTADQNANRTAYGDFNNGAASLAPYLANMDKGRWPANLLLNEQAAEMLDRQSGEARSAGFYTRGPSQSEGPAAIDINAAVLLPPHRRWGGLRDGYTSAMYADAGGPSRFFYTAKTSRAERNAGLNGFDKKPLNWSSGEQNPGSFQAEGTDRESSNHHPTVKPVALMRWLVRLVTTPGGLVLDPFLGSGTTGIAAHLEGFRFIGVERDGDYIKIAEARIRFWQQHGEDTLRVVAEAETAVRERETIRASGQLELLT